MKNIERIGEELRKSGRSDELVKLAQSPDGKAVSRLVDADAVGRAAKSGDTEALWDILRGVLSTEEGRRLAESLRKAMQ